MTVTALQYQIPGALVLLDGVYSMDGNIFEFKGHVQHRGRRLADGDRLESWLLKPVDPFLKKNGAGLELPIAISGTKSDVHSAWHIHGLPTRLPGRQMKQDLQRQASRPQAQALSGKT